jgi:methylated-DNA-[protein]-cysteine S-methyltransferase
MTLARIISSTPKERPMATQTFFIEQIPTPTGLMCLVTDSDGRVRALEWNDLQARLQRMLQRYYGRDTVTLETRPSPSTARAALERYFSGDLNAVDSIAVATNGTLFQREVWTALRRIPPGHTLSYGALAKTIGRPAAVRAVGLANGSNPIGIVVPCHRVIGADRSLTGYGGGLDRKRWLLRHEGVIVDSH